MPKYYEPLSNFAFDFNLRRYIPAMSLTQSQYQEPDSMTVIGPRRGYTYFDHATSTTLGGGWDFNLVVAPR